jgi:hypothetical protein
MPAGPAPRVRGMIRPAYRGQCDTIPAGHGPGRGKRLPANPVPATDGTTSDAVMPSPASSRATTPAWRLTRAVVAAYPPTAGRRTPELTFMMRPVSCARMSGNTAGLLRTLTTFGSGGAGRRRRNRAGRAGIRAAPALLTTALIQPCRTSGAPAIRRKSPWSVTSAGPASTPPNPAPRDGRQITTPRRPDPMSAGGIGKPGVRAPIPGEAPATITTPRPVPWIPEPHCRTATAVRVKWAGPKGPGRRT